MPVTANDVPVPRAPSIGSGRPGSVRGLDDRCPGLLRPHEAQDGLLVRARLIGGRLSADALRALAAAARAGNGIVELTSRANVQVRGLTAEDLEPLGAAFVAAGLLRSASHDRVRNVVADPLAGRRGGSIVGPRAVDAVLDALDDGLCADARLAGLPGRFLFAVDDGSAATAAVDADVRLVPRDEDSWEVDGGALGTEVTATPVSAALALAHRFLVVRHPGTWRVAELPGATASRAAAVVTPGLLGVLPQADGRCAVGALAPLGRLAPHTIDLLADEADTGAGVRVSHRRTVALVDLDPARAPGVLASLAASGMVVTPGSGWEGLTACAGRGACAKALDDVRAGATARATVRGPGAPREHWSGCDRRCGQTPDVARAVVARGAGTWTIDEEVAT